MLQGKNHTQLFYIAYSQPAYTCRGAFTKKDPCFIYCNTEYIKKKNQA